MKKRLISLGLTLALLLSLCTIPAFALGDMNKAGQATTISAGRDFSAVIDENGSLWMWGRNDHGQLGNGGTGNSTTSTSTTTVCGLSFKIPCQTVPVKVMDDVASVSCGLNHTAALKTDGSLWMWGYNGSGQLGNGGGGNGSSHVQGCSYQTVPIKVMDGVAAVSCGGSYTAAIRTDGSLWMWGANGSGNLGFGTNGGNANLNTPVKIMEDVAAVSCGGSHTAAIKTDGSLWMWGAASALGNGNTGNVKSGNSMVQNVPAKIMDGVSEMSCGVDFTVIVKADGTMWSTGSDQSAQLGYRASRGTDSDVWVQVSASGPGQYAAVNCGSSHAAAIRSDGWLFAWGDNDYGQVGSLDRGNYYTIKNAGYDTGYKFYFVYYPTKVGNLEHVAAVSCGSSHTLAVKEDGSVWVWGDNGENLLGNGGLTNDTTGSGGSKVQTLPTQVPGLKAKLPGSFTPTGPFTPDTPPVSASSLFTDVKESDYFADAVVWAVENNITNGTGDNIFSPNRNCTHAEILTFLYRADRGGGTASAGDMAQAVSWAQEKGMIDGAFNGNKACTRAETMVYIWKAFGSRSAPIDGSFTDIPFMSDYQTPVYWAVYNRITNGTNDGTNGQPKTFGPDETCTRGQIVTFLHRAYVPAARLKTQG